LTGSVYYIMQLMKTNMTIRSIIDHYSPQNIAIRSTDSSEHHNMIWQPQTRQERLNLIKKRRERDNVFIDEFIQVYFQRQHLVLIL